MTEKRPIATIDVGDRRREEMGDIDGLARSIKRYGLINAVTVDEKGRLVTGGRRIAACDSLGWTEIDVKSHGDISEAERLEIELEENVQRKGLTQAEKDRNMAARVAVAVQVLTQQAAVGDVISANDLPKSQDRGRPVEPTSDRSVAEYLGVSHTTVQNAVAHVAALDEFPELEDANVGQQQAIRMGETLRLMSVPERADAIADLKARAAQAKRGQPHGRKPKAQATKRPTRPGLSKKTKPPTPDGVQFLRCVYGLEDLSARMHSAAHLTVLLMGWSENDRALLTTALEHITQWLRTLVVEPKEVVS